MSDTSGKIQSTFLSQRPVDARLAKLGPLDDGWRCFTMKLADLPGGEALEIACPKCGAARYATAAELSAHKMPGALDGETVSLADAYLDQIEARLRCRRCGGHGRLSRVWQDKISGFVGGMP